MTSNMNDLIRRAAGVTIPIPATRTPTTDPHPLSGNITPDHDQGQHNVYRHPPESDMNTRIRRAAGVNIRPGQQPAPEQGWQQG